jgi:hypothetical protein
MHSILILISKKQESSKKKMNKSINEEKKIQHTPVSLSIETCALTFEILLTIAHPNPISITLRLVSLVSDNIPIQYKNFFFFFEKK